MKIDVKQLASTDKEAVQNDVLSIYPNWNGERQTLELTEDFEIIKLKQDGERYAKYESVKSPSGYKIHIRPIPDRELTPAEYNEEGNLLLEATYAGETRVDIIYPEGVEFPELATEVSPTNPDVKYSI